MRPEYRLSTSPGTANPVACGWPFLARQLLLLATIFLWSGSVLASDWRVCSTAADDASCEYRGYAGLQQVIDQSANLDRIFIGPGVYTPENHREVRYGKLTIRGGLLIEEKTLELLGEPGAILDGSTGPEVSAILVHGGTVGISGLEIRNFRVALADDDIYEGHGIFVINSNVTIRQVTFKHIPKMSVSIFGSSQVSLFQVRVLDGHVGVWVADEATLKVENSLFSNNDSAGVAAYGTTSATIRNSVFASNKDDGVYAEEQAVVVMTNSILLGNAPYAIRAVDQSKISFDYCIFNANESLFFPEPAGSQLDVGEHLFYEDPGLDAGYLPGSTFQRSRGDPAIRNRDGTVSDIGLSGGPEA